MPVTSLQNLAELIGRFGQLRTQENLLVDVEIVDVKHVWGNLRYKVRPVSGGLNTATVGAERVKLSEVAS